MDYFEEYPNEDLDTQVSPLPHAQSLKLRTLLPEITFNFIEMTRTKAQRIPSINHEIRGSSKPELFSSCLRSPHSELSNEDLMISIHPMPKLASLGTTSVISSLQASSVISLGNSGKFESIKLASTPLNEALIPSSIENCYRVIDVNIKRMRSNSEVRNLKSDPKRLINMKERPQRCRCFTTLGL